MESQVESLESITEGIWGNVKRGVKAVGAGVAQAGKNIVGGEQAGSVANAFNRVYYDTIAEYKSGIQGRINSLVSDMKKLGWKPEEHQELSEVLKRLLAVSSSNGFENPQKATQAQAQPTQAQPTQAQAQPVKRNIFNPGVNKI